MALPIVLRRYVMDELLGGCYGLFERTFEATWNLPVLVWIYSVMIFLCLVGLFIHFKRGLNHF